MILLAPDKTAEAMCRPSAVLLFGAGMVGTAICTALQESTCLASTVLPLDWHRSDLFQDQLASIETRLINLITESSESSSDTGPVHFVWSAGQAGFFATDNQVSRELELYEEILHFIERMAYRYPEVPTSMALVSSAGGLFEGQRGVGTNCIPVPTRPYSRLKLRQEELLLGSAAPLTKKIYRLTSVYGYIRSRQRRGLIPTLVANGLCQRPSQITGYSTTMRDYVWVEDVAEYISRALLEQESNGEDSVEILASGKPSSILEIQQIVEQAISRPLYLQYTPDATNGVTMSFDAGVLPRNWHPSELTTNVRKIAVDALSRQTMFVE